MADSNILSDFGINILEQEIDDVIFQTNEFLCDATFTDSQGPFWWLAHFCTSFCLQLYVNQLLAKFCSVRQIPDGTKTGQNHKKIKSRTLQALHPLSWTSLFTAKVRFCPVKNKQNLINILSIKHLYHIGIFGKILQVLHAQTCVAYSKGLLKSVLCHLYTTHFRRCTLPWTNVQPICHYQQC